MGTTQLDTVVDAYVSRIDINCISGMLEVIHDTIQKFSETGDLS